ncbi:MAG: YqeG family HAD IIIA-type phosphatase [Peptococcaceae bacterium]|jgi:HAD superfamily phosphatase (TIGR01668 family)|nr:YqeG family HAD IIIA-type phosphatase [Peptococcaceae bacterium]
MLGSLRPDFQYHRIQDIKIEDLTSQGIKGLLLDLDNTITPWNDRTVTPEVINWFKKVKEAGLRACIVSNNTLPDRVSAVADILDIMYVYNAAKPSKKAFQMSLDTLGLKSSEVVVIGDQIFTDVFGANRLKIKTVLVSPIDQREFAGTKILRLMERLVGRKVRYTRDYLEK